MWHTFNWNIWVPNVNIIKDVHCTAKLPTCYMARPRCPVCGHSSQRIYNCQPCLQSGSSLSCRAPPTEAGTWAITFLLLTVVTLLACIETPCPCHPGPHSAHCAPAARTRDPETAAATTTSP